MGVIDKRFQQGIFEALASSNRAAGSGAGSGIGLGVELGSASIGSVSGITATGSPTVVTGSTINFALSRPTTIIVQGTLNTGSNCAAGSFNLLALNGDGNLTVQGNSWPYALLLGVGAGTINYLPATLFAVAFGETGTHSVNWQVQANTTGSVTVNNGFFAVFALG